MRITIRQVTESDYDFLLALSIEAMKDYVEEVYGWDEAFQEEYFRKSFKPEHKRIIQCDGIDAGMYYVVDEDECYVIKRIQVLREYQNRGIGTEALRKILKRAERQSKAVKLRVFKINPARSLYERHGFQITGETETHYHMEKPHNK